MMRWWSQVISSQVWCKDSVHEYHELSECKNLEIENMESYTYEAVLSERASDNTKDSSMFFHTGKTDSQILQENISDVTKLEMISDANLSSSNVGSQYNVLDHTVLSNPVQQGIVKAVVEESSIKDPYNIKCQVHKQSVVSYSSEDSTHPLQSLAVNQEQREGSPHIYQKLDHNTSATQATAPQETTLKKPMESTGDHEYHVLEEVNAQQNRSTSDLFIPSSSVTSAKVGSGREKLLYKSEQSPTVVFDDSLYSSLPNDTKNTDGQSEKSKADVNKLNPLPEGELLVTNCHDSVFNANDRLLSECEQNPPMLFDDPLYSMLPPDKRTTATPSQVMINESDEQCHPADTDNTGKPDELCFDDVQEIHFKAQTF